MVTIGSAYHYFREPEHKYLNPLERRLAERQFERKLNSIARRC
jgi:hypothetical protein